MSEFLGNSRVRNLIILVLVTLVHTALFALVLKARFHRPDHPNLPALNIEIAELEPERSTDPVREPEPPPEREALRSEPVPEPVPIPVPEPVPSSMPARELSEPARPSETPLSNDNTRQRPAVLTQLDPAQIATDAAPDGQANRIGPAETAKVLQHFRCQNFTSRPDQACPKPDPFDVAEARQTRAAARRDPIPVIAIHAQNTLEQFFSRQDRDPHMFPGMDADLFSDPMAAGSHNAARIRNGQAPIWDRDLEATLKRQNE